MTESRMSADIFIDIPISPHPSMGLFAMSAAISPKLRAVALGFVAAGATVALSGCGAILGAAQEAAQEVATPAAPTGAEEVTSDVFSIAVGDCLNDETTTGEVEEVPTIACDQPHDSEVYAETEVTDGEFPGAEALDQQAEDACYTEFETFVGMPYEESVLLYSWYVPTEQSWASGDRQIDCIISDPEGQVTGTLANAMR
jgi:hypothetical protein